MKYKCPQCGHNADSGGNCPKCGAGMIENKDDQGGGDGEPGGNAGQPNQ